MNTIDIDTLYKYYKENEDYRRYVDECAKAYNKDIQKILETEIAKEYYKYLTSSN